jgi:hypothetical protein
MKFPTYKKVSRYGPGGRNCTCCGPAPRERKAHDRTMKRRERQKARKRIDRQIEEMV